MLKVVLERDCFDEFLDSWGDLALVSPCIEALKVWCDSREEVGNVLETGVVFFDDAGWKRGLEGSDTMIPQRGQQWAF